VNPNAVWSERAAALCHRLRFDARARTALVVVICAAVLAVAFVRPARIETLVVEPLLIGAIGDAVVGRYVRVSGMLRTDETMKRYLRLGEILGRGYGPEFTSLVDPTNGAVVWVREDGFLPSEANAPATLVGRVMRGEGGAPERYLVVGRPPLVIAAEWVTWLGAAALAASIGLAALVWAAARLEFALPSLWRPSREAHDPADADAAHILFYGGLGFAFDDAQLRGAMARMEFSVHEARILAMDDAGWSVVIRRVVSADTYDAASAGGVLAGLRLRFEDDRGLLRTAVLAGTSRRARTVLIAALGNLRQ
jgi:hypothetical protein